MSDGGHDRLDAAQRVVKAQARLDRGDERLGDNWLRVLAMCQPPGLGAQRAELRLHGAERQRRQIANSVQAEQLQALQHVGIEQQQVTD